MSKLALIISQLMIAGSVIASSATVFAGEWYENIKFHGDFLYRHEWIEEADKNEDRQRDLIQARVGFETLINETFDFGFGLASGSDDPISANQTLGDEFSKKPVWIDLAYFDWHPYQDRKFHLQGGKIVNPFFVPGKLELIWDKDLRPEGLALLNTFELCCCDFFTNLGGFWVEERSSAADTGLFGAQSGLIFDYEKWVLTTGVSYFDYGNIKGSSTLRENNSFGNMVDEFGCYTQDYNELEAFLEYKFKTGFIPFSLFGDYVINTAVDREGQEDSAEKDDSGYLVGFQIGNCKDPGSVEFGYNYREVEKDSVVGAFTDSNFRGSSTDGKGHTLNFAVQAAKRVQIGLRYFYNYKGIEEEIEYQRFQADLKLNF